MEKYDFKSIEEKWQKIWEENYYGKSEDFSEKPKNYNLVEFPYPSGAGLHVGHCMGYGASDAYCRMKRLQGYNVMYPIGWDAFGLPTENYAIKTGVLPQVATEQNIATFKRQIKSLGYSFDWSREVNTTDPDYYKWTQWIFLQFYKHGIVDGKLVEVADSDTTTPRLAYQSEMPINWCPSCKIGLANEEVINGRCERCGAETIKKMQKQWILRITAYADRLIDDLNTVDYLDKIKTQQINWIGRSTGTNIRFKLVQEKRDPSSSAQDDAGEIEVFTTRADTLFGVTYVVLAPEHPLVENFKFLISNFKEVENYIAESKKKSDLERTELQKEKTGVELKGIKAINPINGEEVAVWVADYVLASYGTGAVMAVPAHDERDFEFAKKYNIPIKEVVIPYRKDKKNPPEPGKENTKRNVVHGIVRDPETGKYLGLKWMKQPWVTFVTGGIEDGEDVVDAARREIAEETGYKNLKLMRVLGGSVRSEFYAAHKNVNRLTSTQAVLFELENDEKLDVSKEEQEIHEPIWMDIKDINADTMTCCELDIWLARLDGDVAFTEYGYLINSNGFDGLSSEEAKKKITEKLKELGAGDFTVNFKLRDWIFSRQHYWGEPIPIVHCEKDGIVSLNEDQLPLVLPEVENYKPTDTGESPLAAITGWVNTTCPKCGGPAKRETDTMPNWAGSSWYFLAYAMNQELRIKNQGEGNVFKKRQDELNYWMPVDLYNGGMEHTTLHLLYSRFWNKFLYDLGVVPTSEPYARRIAHGIILGPDGQKMSKSRGNVINPDEIVREYGADTLRAYVMFIGPYDQESAWSTAGVQGVYRFLTRVWNNQAKAKEGVQDVPELLIKLNQTVAGVTLDLENYRLNTVVSKLMELNNTIEKVGEISWASYAIFLQLLYPVAPHLASELWMKTFPVLPEASIEYSVWPKADSKYLVAEEIEIVVQINGKVRDKIMVKSDISDEDLKQIALSSEKVKSFVGGAEIKKIIVVPKKLVSIVI